MPRFSIVWLAVAAAALVTGACSADTGNNTPAESVATTDAVPLSLDEPAESVDIVIGSVELERMTTFAPEGWEYDGATGAFHQPDGGAEWLVERRCPDPCSAKTDAEWIVAAEPLLEQLVGPLEQAATNDLSPGRHYVVAEGPETTAAAMVRWVSGSRELIVCRAQGPVGLMVDLGPVLEFACDNTSAALE